MATEIGLIWTLVITGLKMWGKRVYSKLTFFWYLRGEELFVFGENKQCRGGKEGKNFNFPKQEFKIVLK